MSCCYNKKNFLYQKIIIIIIYTRVKLWLCHLHQHWQRKVLSSDKSRYILTHRISSYEQLSPEHKSLSPCSRNVENHHDLARERERDKEKGGRERTGERMNDRVRGEERKREVLLPDNIYSPWGSMARPVTASM